MQCPICGKDVEIQKKQVGVNEQGAPVFQEYAVCHDCKKQWNLNRQRVKKKSSSTSGSGERRTRTPAERTLEGNRANASGEGIESKRNVVPVRQGGGPEAAPTPKKRATGGSVVPPRRGMAEENTASPQKRTAEGKSVSLRKGTAEGKASPSQKGIPREKAAPPRKAPAEGRMTERPDSKVPRRATAGKDSSGQEAVRVHPVSKDSADRSAVRKSMPSEVMDKKERRQTAAPQKKNVAGEKVHRAGTPDSSEESRKLQKTAASGKVGTRNPIERKEDSRQEGERIQKKAPVQRSVKNPAVEKRDSSQSLGDAKRESMQKKNPAVEEQRYGNIPSEKIRAKKEQAVKQAYEEMLSTDSGQEKFKKKKRMVEEEVEKELPTAKGRRVDPKGYDEEAEEEEEMEYEEPTVRFRVVRIIFGILSLIAFGFFAYRGFFAGLDNIASASNSGTGTTYIVFALCMLISGLVLLILQNRNTIFAFVVPMAFYLGGAVFAFLKRGEDSLLLYSAIVGAVLGVVFLVLGVISGNQEEYDDYEDSEEDSDDDSRADDEYDDDEYDDDEYDDDEYDDYDDEE